MSDKGDHFCIIGPKSFRMFHLKPDTVLVRSRHHDTNSVSLAAESDEWFGDQEIAALYDGHEVYRSVSSRAVASSVDASRYFTMIGA